MVAMMLLAGQCLWWWFETDQENCAEQSNHRPTHNSWTKDQSHTHFHLRWHEVHNYLREFLVVQRSLSPHPGAACAAPPSVSAAPSLGPDCLEWPAPLPEVGSLLARRGTQCQSHSGRSPRRSPGERFLTQKLSGNCLNLMLTTFIDSSWRRWVLYPPPSFSLYRCSSSPEPSKSSSSSRYLGTDMRVSS